MCGICGVLGEPAHWSSAQGRLRLAQPANARAERASVGFGAGGGDGCGCPGPPARGLSGHAWSGCSTALRAPATCRSATGRAARTWLPAPPAGRNWCHRWPRCGWRSIGSAALWCCPPGIGGRDRPPVGAGGAGARSARRRCDRSAGAWVAEPASGRRGTEPASGRQGAEPASGRRRVARGARNRWGRLMDSRLPVNVLTGFLGSGKTSLLNRLLRDPAFSHCAVLINEFGTIGIDHHLVEAVDGDLVLLSSGCVCCTIRGDLRAAIRGLYERRERGAVAPFTRLLIETTGLADPTPVLATVMHDPVLRAHLRAGNVITTVDAVHAHGQLERHPQSRKQVAVADRLGGRWWMGRACSARTCFRSRARARNSGAGWMPRGNAATPRCSMAARMAASNLLCWSRATMSTGWRSACGCPCCCTATARRCCASRA